MFLLYCLGLGLAVIIGVAFLLFLSWDIGTL